MQDQQVVGIIIRRDQRFKKFGIYLYFYLTTKIRDLSFEISRLNKVESEGMILLRKNNLESNKIDMTSHYFSISSLIKLETSRIHHHKIDSSPR